MRLFLFIAGVFAVIVCIEKPAEAEQNGAWCLYQDGDSGGGSPQCRYATLQQCLADRLGAQSIPVLAGITSANKVPKALNDYDFRRSSGSFAIFAAPRLC